MASNLPKNTLARSIGGKTMFPDIENVVSSATTFVEGDLLIFNDTTNRIERPAAEADGAFLIGVAPVAVTAGKPPQVYVTDVDASAAIPAQMGPVYGNAYRVILKAGDAILPGDSLYLDVASGFQNVTKTAGTKAIGTYYGKALTAATGGTVIEILVGARWPNDTLKF